MDFDQLISYRSELSTQLVSMYSTYDDDNRTMRKLVLNEISRIEQILKEIDEKLMNFKEN